MAGTAAVIHDHVGSGVGTKAKEMENGNPVLVIPFESWIKLYLKPHKSEPLHSLVLSQFELCFLGVSGTQGKPASVGEEEGNVCCGFSC